MCQADEPITGDAVSPEGALQSEGSADAGRIPLGDIIAAKFKEVEAVLGADPWVTRTPGEAANYIAGYTQALSDAAEIAEANWHSMKMFGTIYATAACDAGNRIAYNIRALNASNAPRQTEEPCKGDERTAPSAERQPDNNKD